MIKLIAEAAEQDAKLRPKLYRMVAERIRARLSPKDAAIVARWFDQLAAGEDATKIFPSTKVGRPKGSTNQPRADDIDIAWIVRQHMEAGQLKPGEIYSGVAKAHGMKPGTVANIYSRVKKQEGW